MRIGLRSAQKMTYSPFLNRAGITNKTEIVAQMADDCRVIAANTGSVLADDLELLGWTPAQIEQHGKSAARQARAESEHAG